MSDYDGMFETVKNSEQGKTTDELISESQRSSMKQNKAALERRQALVQKISGENVGVKGKISALNKIQELNKMLLPRYIMKLEEAAMLLASYESELDDLDNKLQKMTPIMRSAMGGESVDRIRKRVKTSLHKLQIHQEATIERLTRYTR